MGLSMSPPEHALVLCCDGNSLVQALDRTQSELPLKKGRVATETHDYKRNGTTMLFAALNQLPPPSNNWTVGILAIKARAKPWHLVVRTYTLDMI